jgi:hypothetical protein
MTVVIVSYIASMFDTTNFELNNTLIDECLKLIKEHNDISYTQVSLLMETVSFSHISKSIPKDKPSTELVSFFEIYVYQTVVAHNLSTLIDSIDYKHEDLVANIDRSDAGIMKLMTSLTGIRLKLMDLHTKILGGIAKQGDEFIRYIDREPIPDIKLFVDTVFVCMGQEGLEKYIKLDKNSRYFVAIGSKIVEKLYPQIRNANLSEYVHAKINYLKEVILATKVQLNVPFDSINKLQTFNVFPNEGDSIDIKTAMLKLFGIEVDAADLLSGLQSIELALKQLSIDKNRETGLIVMTNINNDTYFDITPLSSIVQSQQVVGVNPEMISQTNLIKYGGKATVKKSEMLAINTTNDTQQAFILWTNDMKHFKYRQTPITNALIQKLLRRVPSQIIESYNRILTELIDAAKKYDDAIAFKRVQYMAFTESITEESFLKALQDDLDTFIQKNISDDKWLLSQSFMESVLDIIDSHKNKLGIKRALLSAHCHIIYNSMAMRIVNRIRRKLLVSHTKQDISAAVIEATSGNDNIYTRTIASYYLHIA